MSSPRTVIPSPPLVEPAAFDRVLVAVDGGPGTRDALALARAVAAARRASITALSVFSSRTPLGRGGGAYALLVRAEAEDAARAAARSLDDVAGAETRAVAADDPAAELARAACDSGAGLVVVGSARHAPPGRAAPGRLALHLLHGAPVPVAVAPVGYADARPTLRQIGLGHNASREAAAAVPFALGLARDAGGSLHVWHAVERSIVADAALWAAAHVLAREWAQEELDDLRRRLPDDVEIHLELLDGAPADALSASSGTVDLLVVGSRSYGRFGRTMLGSVSASLIRTAACPVVVVPRPAGARA